ncbi:MAG: isocitrate lyase/PEP mutase family protein [Acidobacteriota bacterium]|nr:isocitrate lyase/PEP mutase family protein [Acidobacteriota bacterium]
MSNRVQRIIDEQHTLVFPGVYDTLSAKIAERVGFPMAFVSGYAVSATLIGQPDMGLLTQTEVVERARQICGAVSIPIIVDADTGYGNALNVVRTVSALIDAGAAGCFLEDQLWPKKCGHMRGKQVIDREAYLQKIRAAVATKGDRDFFVVARTDAVAVVGLEEAMARADLARAAGADATFVEAPGSLDELKEVGRRAPKPTVANMVEQGRTPVLSQAALAELGFNLILYPVAGLYASAHALANVYEHLREQGTTTGATDRMMAFQQFNDLIGVDDTVTLAARFEETGALR